MIDIAQVEDFLKVANERKRAYAEALEQGTIYTLSSYIKHAWNIVEPGRRYIHNWHIDAIAEHLEALTLLDIRNLIINIPPRHQKSLSVSVFWPTWVWTWLPEIRWLFSSYAEALAIRDSLKCRNIIQSNWYQEHWADVFSLAGDQNQKTRFNNNKTGYRLAVGVGGSGTGEGGDVLVTDDPHKMQEVESTVSLTAVTEWWDKTMSTRGNDPETVCRLIIMQRGHENDLTGHAVEQMQQGGEYYELLILPAEYDPTPYVFLGNFNYNPAQYRTSLGFRDPRTKSGELLWPERFKKASVSKLKVSLGTRGSSAQLQQRPSPAEGNIFKRFWWRFWQPKGVTLPPVQVRITDDSGNTTLFECPVIALPDDFDEQIQSWDMSFKDTKSSAKVAGQVWGNKGADRFLLDQVNERMDFTHTISEVLLLTSRWPRAMRKLVESAANGPAVISVLHNRIPGLMEVAAKDSKVARAYAATPTIESGNTYLPHPSLYPWVNGFIDEHAGFPNTTFKDQVDAHTQAQAYFNDLFADQQEGKGYGEVVVTTVNDLFGFDD